MRTWRPYCVACPRRSVAMVDNTVYLVPAVGLWLSAVWRLPTLRQGGAARALALALLALALTATLEVPLAEQAFDGLFPGVANLSYLVKHVLVVHVGVAALVVLRHITLPGSTARAGDRRRGRIALGVSLLLVVLFLLAPVDGEASAEAFTNRYADEVLIVSFWLVFLTWLSHALVATMRLTALYGRRAPRSPLRTGILLIGSSAAVCLVYALVKLVYLVARPLEVLRPDQLELYAPVSRILTLGSMVLITAGCVWPTLARIFPRASLRSARHHHNLAFLWDRMVETTPSIRLAPSRSELPPWDTEERLYRRVVEIRDGLLALRGYVPRGTQARTGELIAEGVPAGEASVVAEAVGLEMARRAEARGEWGGGARAHPMGGGQNLEAEAELLERLSVSWRQHRGLVTAVAEQLEDELQDSRA